MFVIRIVLGLAIVASGAASAAPAADQDRTWRGRDNQVLAQGTLVDVQGELVTIFDSGRRQETKLRLPQLADEDRQYVIRALSIARRFGAASSEAVSVAKPEDTSESAEGGAAETPPRSPLVALRLNVAPQVVQWVRIVGDGTRRVVVQQKTPDEIVRIVSYDGASGEVCGEYQLPENAEMLDVSPDGRSVVVHCHSGDRPGPEEHWLEVHSLADGKMIWSREKWLAGVFNREVRFLDTRTLIESHSMGPEVQAVRTWAIEEDAQAYRQLLQRVADLSQRLVHRWNNLRFVQIDPDVFQFLREPDRQRPQQEWRLEEEGVDCVFGRLGSRVYRHTLQRVADLCQRLVHRWNNRRFVQIDPDVFQFLRELGRQRPQQEWRLRGDRVVCVYGYQGARAFAVGRSGICPFGCEGESEKAPWHYSLGSRRLAVPSIGFDPTTESIAFVARDGGGQALDLIILADDGSLIAQQPIRSLFSLGGSPECLPMGKGYWALVRRERGSFDSGWARETTVHVFDERRGSIVWTYTIDRALVPTDAPAGRFWWAMPAPDSLAQTVVAGMSLPDPRATHFLSWSVTTKEPVLAEGAAVKCFSRIDKRAFKGLHFSERRRLGKGIPLALNELQLVEKPEADYTIYHEVVSQRRGGAADIYNVVAAISIFDQEDRLLCRNIRVCSLEDRYGDCGNLEGLLTKWPRARERLWQTAIGAFRGRGSERFARGLGDPTGMGTTSLSHSPETLTKMSQWTPEPGELVNPLRDLADELAAEEAEIARFEASLREGEPRLARAFVKTWQAQVDPPTVDTDWTPMAGLEIEFDKAVMWLITHPHASTPYVAIRDGDVRCYDLRTGRVTGRVVTLKPWINWDGSCLDPLGKRIAIQTTDRKTGKAIEVYAFDPSPPPDRASLSTGELLEQQADPVVRISVSAKGYLSNLIFTSKDQLVSVVDDRAVVADAVTGVVHRVIPFELENVGHVITDVSPGGCYLAHPYSESGSLYGANTRIRLVDLRNGVVAGFLDCPESMETRESTVAAHRGALKFSPDGRYLACFVKSYFVCWDLRNREIVCDVDVTGRYQRMATLDRGVYWLRDRLGILHWLPDSSSCLVLGCLLVNRKTGQIQDAMIEQPVVLGHTLPGFRPRVVPGPVMFQQWVVKEDGDLKSATTFSAIQAVE